jgi:hypothetical protein
MAGDALKREVGQAFDYALSRAKDPTTGLLWTKGGAAMAMGYTDQGVIGRWISGVERVQLDKVRLLGDDFFWEFVCALGALCAGVKAVTHLQRTA